MFEAIKKYAVLIIGAIVIGIIFFITNDKKTDIQDRDDQADIIFSDEKQIVELETAVDTDHVILVDIKGEVEQPGVYELRSGDRVNDAIKLADGFTSNADETSVNLAQKVQDEMVIFVNKEGENHGATSVFNEQDKKVKINIASEADIVTLNGIGQAKAQAIIKHREEQGLFSSEEDLLEVSGIGEKTLENIRDDIEIP
ncbi:helix-hairpin-helix domain-containing protein [Virgibacillus sp. W0181]|uniref:helix-hairpin-helix domain-containing protein n=1 Tax=Virgibacillus sp. W0181 TaxID=3391581 RepID=UPI003F450825